MTTRVSFTGGSGFIGRYCYEKFQAEFSDLEIDSNLDLVQPEFDYVGNHVQGDVRSSETCEKICANTDVIIHLAAAHRDFGIERDEYFDVNENGTLQLLNAMDRKGVRKLIFTSSVAVYNPDDNEISEATKPDPQNPYGASKLAAEKRIEDWVAADSQRLALIIRPTVVIGPRNQATMYSLIDQIKRGKYLFNIGSGKNVKSLAVVSNLVNFMGEWASQQPDGQIHVANFVDGPQLQTTQIVDIIHEELGMKRPTIGLPIGVVSAMAFPVDLLTKCIGKRSPITPARVKKFGTQTKFDAAELQRMQYDPEKTTEQGLREMVRWYLDVNGST